ncbi:MAG: hypothetical protein ACXVAK_14190 [Vulcanimicrobiaceae bacterium]
MRIALLCALLVALQSGTAAVPVPAATESPDPATELIAAMSAHNASLTAYTFDVHVHVAMHSFPWLRFSMDGTGEYQRNGQYMVHFRHVPWFGRGFENLSMTTLDPVNWPKQYEMSVVQHDGDVSVLSMHEQKGGGLKDIRATVDQNAGVREIAWEYKNGGLIRLSIAPAQVGKYSLPASEDAVITVPIVKATAHGEFTNYRIVSEQTANL